MLVGLALVENGRLYIGGLKYHTLMLYNVTLLPGGVVDFVASGVSMQFLCSQCRPLEFHHSKLVVPSLSEPRFVQKALP